MKRIGLDARIGRRISAGMATYIREIAARIGSVAPEFDFRVYDRGGNFGIAEQILLPLAMRRDRIELTHYLAHYVPYITPRPFVFTIHDLIHLRFVHQFHGYIGPYYRTVVGKACRNAVRIITSDRRTIGDLVHYYGIDPQNVCVIPLAARELFFGDVEPFVAPRPYLLNVGNHRAHKDMPTLLEAWSSLPDRYEIDLYLTGPDDFAGELQRRSNHRRRAVALGNVSDERLASYYAGAQALVHPALLEGFGLPLAEAMTVGCPVIATTDAIPEPLAAAALAFPPGDVEAARCHLERVLSDEAFRKQRISSGRRIARALTWDATARATANVYRDIFAEGAS